MSNEMMELNKMQLSYKMVTDIKFHIKSFKKDYLIGILQKKEIKFEKINPYILFKPKEIIIKTRNLKALQNITEFQWL